MEVLIEISGTGYNYASDTANIVLSQIFGWDDTGVIAASVMKTYSILYVSHPY
ncbi:hypothetical protein Plhal703r1_c25g0106681 [Plasmopara halstedii]